VTNANTNIVTDIDVSDAGALDTELSLDNMTIDEFNAALARIAAGQHPRGGYAKVRATLCYVHDGAEHEHKFRIDVSHCDYRLTLAKYFAQQADFWCSDRGRAFAALNDDDPALFVRLYTTLAQAAA